MSNHFTAVLTPDTVDAVSANTNHCVTGFYFFKYLKGIQVGNVLVPIKVKLTGDFAVKQGVEGKIVTVREDGFFDEEGVKLDNIFTINTVISEQFFKFGVRFKYQNDAERVKMFVN